MPVGIDLDLVFPAGNPRPVIEETYIQIIVLVIYRTHRRIGDRTAFEIEQRVAAVHQRIAVGADDLRINVPLARRGEFVAYQHQIDPEPFRAVRTRHFAVGLTERHEAYVARPDYGTLPHLRRQLLRFLLGRLGAQAVIQDFLSDRAVFADQLFIDRIERVDLTDVPGHHLAHIGHFFLVFADFRIAQTALLLQGLQQRIGFLPFALVMNRKRIVQRFQRVIIVQQRSELTGQRIPFDGEILLHLLDLHKVDRRQRHQDHRHDDNHDLQSFDRLVRAAAVVSRIVIVVVIVIRASVVLVAIVLVTVVLIPVTLVIVRLLLIVIFHNVKRYLSVANIITF